jgi:hypothetical protein
VTATTPNPCVSRDFALLSLALSRRRSRVRVPSLPSAAARSAPLRPAFLPRSGGPIRCPSPFAHPVRCEAGPRLSGALGNRAHEAGSAAGGSPGALERCSLPSSGLLDTDDHGVAASWTTALLMTQRASCDGLPSGSPWTSSRSDMRLDRIDPVHRHDRPPRKVLTGLSSNTVALAIAWLEPRAEPLGHWLLSPDCERLRSEPKTLAPDERRGAAGELRDMPECAGMSLEDEAGDGGLVCPR